MPKNMCGRGTGAQDCAFGIQVTVRTCLDKRFEKKKIRKTLRFSDCQQGIRKRILPCYRKTYRFHFVFVWFRESNEIQRFERIFGLRSKCLAKESHLFQCLRKVTKTIFRAQKGLGTSLALQCRPVGGGVRGIRTNPLWRSIMEDSEHKLLIFSFQQIVEEWKTNFQCCSF